MNKEPISTMKGKTIDLTITGSVLGATLISFSTEHFFMLEYRG